MEIERKARAQAHLNFPQAPVTKCKPRIREKSLIKFQSLDWRSAEIPSEQMGLDTWGIADSAKNTCWKFAWTKNAQCDR